MKNFLLRPALALSVLLASSSIHALPVYINEFHYDNQGVDENEFVEIAGEMGTDLQGWSLEFYNGGNGRVYMTWDLSGSFSDQQAGYGVLGFTGSRGIQNGRNDGIALVDNLGQLVQFISYEGTLLAQDGAAQGQSSADVGVSEPPSTALGSSIQLSGLAESSEGFEWVIGQSSFGAFNPDQFYQEPSSSSQAQDPIASVPEPSSLSMLGLGMLMAGGLRRRYKKQNI